MRKLAFAICLLITSDAASLVAQTAHPPAVDRRSTEVRGLDTRYAFPPPASKEAWLSRAEYLRGQILASAGLWPLPKKTALNAQIFDRTEHQDYSVEKVYFESYPGFYVTGNLYRPRGKTGPFPAVLVPHGHWAHGRLENSELTSDQGLCINFARRGLAAFSYDMVGYNDGGHLDHHLKQGNGNRRALTAQDKEYSLWGFGALPLQLWNAIRAVDFLETLPDVDRNNLGCTGASGGGTQTFLLSAVDSRIKVAAPVNMISHSMQGGCSCENTSNLRLDTNNMELAALIAPRPLLMVSATGDWTRDTPRVEHPALRNIYELWSAADKLHTVQIDAPHNYNRASREAVYAWFARWLLKQQDGEPLKETNFTVDPLGKLLVFHNKLLPAEAKTQEQLFDDFKARAVRQLAELQPRDAGGLARFRAEFTPALRHSLAAEFPAQAVAEPAQTFRPGAAAEFVIARAGRGDRVPAKAWLPRGKTAPRAATLVVHPAGVNAFSGADDELIDSLLRKNHMVLAISAFNTRSAPASRDTDKPYFTTYNQTDAAHRVQDILTALSYLKNNGATRLNLLGLGEAGLWCLLARALAPELGQTAVDVAQFDASQDSSFLEKLYVPLLRRAGDFKTALTVAPASPLLIHNTGGKFEVEWGRQAYQLQNAAEKLRVEEKQLPVGELVNWLE